MTEDRDPIIIGKVKEHRSYRSPVLWTYKDVKYDRDGWANVDEFLPMEFDLCQIKTDKEIKMSGWYTGQLWDGKNVREDHKIKYWKILRQQSI